MARRTLITMLGGLLLGQALAQPSIEWQRALGGSLRDHAQAVEQTNDGGYIVAGYSFSNDGDVGGNYGTSDVWVVKLDAAGAVQWEKNYGGSYGDVAWSVQQTTDGGYVVAGYTYSNDGDVTGLQGESDYWVLKLDATGALQWQKTLGGSDADIARSVRQTSDGGYVIAGGSESDDGDVVGEQGWGDYWVVKLDASGSLVWAKTLGGGGGDAGLFATGTSDGGYIVCGGSQSVDGDVTGHHGPAGYDYWVVKLNASGQMEWQKALGGVDWDTAYQVEQTSDGGYIVGGYAESIDGDVTAPHGEGDFWLVKLDATGALQWEKSYGGTDHERAFSMALRADGGCVLAGWTRSNDGDVSGFQGVEDYWAIGVDAAGSLIWQRTMGGTDEDWAMSIAATSDDGCVVAGYTLSDDGDVTGYHGGDDAWVVKLSGSGDAIEEEHSPLFTISTHPGTIWISLSEEQLYGVLSMTDMLGQEMLRQRISGDHHELDVRHLSQGTYVISVQNALGISSQRVVFD